MPFHQVLVELIQTPPPSRTPAPVPLASQVKSGGMNVMGGLTAAVKLIPETAVAVKVIVSAAE